MTLMQEAVLRVEAEIAPSVALPLLQLLLQPLLAVVVGLRAALVAFV